MSVQSAPTPSNPSMPGAASSLLALEGAAPFTIRHIGPSPDDRAKMLALLGHADLEALVDAAVPPSIRSFPSQRAITTACNCEGTAILTSRGPMLTSSLWARVRWRKFGLRAMTSLW